MMMSFRSMMLGCTCAGLIAGCFPESADESGGVKVGLIAPYTGEFSAMGVNIERSLMVLQDLVNKEGGVAGQPLDIVFGDSHSDATRGLASAEAIAADTSVLAIMGPEENELIALLQEQQAASWAHLLPGITAGDVVSSMDPRWFRIGPAAEGMGCALAERVYDLGYRNIAVVHAPDRLNNALARSMGTTLDNYNLTGRANYTLVPVESDAGSIGRALQQVSAVAPDAIVLATSSKTGAQVVQDWVSTSTKNVKWFVTSSLMTRSFLVNIPPGSLDGASGITPAVVSEMDASAVRSQVRAQFGDDPFVGSYFYVDAFAVAILAIEAAYQKTGGPPSRADVRAQIHAVAEAPGTRFGWDELPQALAAIRNGEDVDYVGITGNLTLDSSGMTNQETMRYQLETIQGVSSTFEGFRVCVPL